MLIPDGYTEQEVLDTLQIVANRLAGKFIFGSYTIDDIKQEAIFEGMKCLPKYKPETGRLENFVYVCVRSRLKNLKRNKFQRLNKPCGKCPLKAYIKESDECTAYCSKSECELYAIWEKKSSAKKNVVTPIGLDCVEDENENGMKNCIRPDDTLQSKEIFDLINAKMPAQYRHDYNKILANVKISRNRKKKIREIVTQILNGEQDGESDS